MVDSIKPSSVIDSSTKATRLKDLNANLPRLVIPEVTILLDEFCLFPMLPRELRFKIWGLAAYVPRDIKLYLKRSTQTYHSAERNDGPRVADQSQHTAILQVNQESRFEAMKFYTVFMEKLPLSRRDVLEIVSHDGSARFKSFAYIRPSRPIHNTIYVNLAIDRFIVSDLPGNYGESSIEDYNFEVNDLGKIKHLFVKPKAKAYVPRFLIRHVPTDVFSSLVSLTIALRVIPVRENHRLEYDLDNRTRETLFRDTLSKDQSDKPYPFKLVVLGQAVDVFDAAPCAPVDEPTKSERFEPANYPDLLEYTLDQVRGII